MLFERVGRGGKYENSMTMFRLGYKKTLVCYWVASLFEWIVLESSPLGPPFPAMKCFSWSGRVVINWKPWLLHAHDGWKGTWKVNWEYGTLKWKVSFLMLTVVSLIWMQPVRPEDEEKVCPIPSPGYSNSCVPVWHKSRRTGWGGKFRQDSEQHLLPLSNSQVHKESSDVPSPISTTAFSLCRFTPST